LAALKKRQLPQRKEDRSSDILIKRRDHCGNFFCPISANLRHDRRAPPDAWMSFAVVRASAGGWDERFKELTRF